MRNAWTSRMVLGLAAWLALPAWGDSVRLYDQAASEDAIITLEEVAELEGEALALASIEVARFADGQRAMTVSLEQVRQALSDSGVRWSVVSLRGYMRCEVQQLRSERPVVAVDEALPVVGNEQAVEVAIDRPYTLEDRIEQGLAAELGVALEDLRLSFSERDVEALRAPAVSGRYEIEVVGGARVGRVIVAVRRYLSRPEPEVWRFSVEVARRHLAVVAARSIDRHARLSSRDLRIASVWQTRASEEPVSDLQLVIGQTAAQTMDEGEVVTPDSIRPPVVVQRGADVVMQAVVGGVEVTASARAMEDGAIGETIRLQRPGRREPVHAVVVGRNRVEVEVSGATR